MNKFINNPLVSVVVITYNSSKYVLETLESAKAQTYQNIELIISDDGSTDNTVEICQDWIENNSERFIRIKLIESSHNTGIPSNCNRGVKDCKGDWVKLIAGDDMLLPNCIGDNKNFIDVNNVHLLFSNVKIVNEWGEEQLSNEKINKRNKKNYFYKLDAKSQFYHLLIKSYPMFAPTMFFKRSTLEILGGFNEDYINEDSPLYLKATKNGYNLSYMPIQTVAYRIHSKSHSIRFKNNDAVSKWMKIKLRETVKPYINFSLLQKAPLIYIEHYSQFLNNEMLILLGNKKSTKKYVSFIRYASPLVVKRKIKNLLSRY